MRRYTITQFNKDFPNDDACLEWLRNQRYPKLIDCPNCKKPTKYHRIKTRKVYGCDLCGHQISPTAGTIFEHSPTSLNHWFYAIYLMSATRCGISAKQIEREIGVTYKTAWRMFNQIRSLLQSSPRASSGEFEIDETYIGGKRTGKRGRGASGKTTVFGIAKREGDISASKTSNLKSATVYPLIKKRILEDSQVYTDEFPVYDRLWIQGYNHKRVYHSSQRSMLLVKSTQTRLRASGHYLKEVSLEFITLLATSIYRITLTSMCSGITTEKMRSLCF